jgi:hypothetical protein
MICGLVNSFYHKLQVLTARAQPGNIYSNSLHHGTIDFSFTV